MCAVLHHRTPHSACALDGSGCSQQRLVDACNAWPRTQNRLFAANKLPVDKWGAVAYQRLALLNRDLGFDVDLSGVQCGCNAAVYLVHMGLPNEYNPGYCDIQGFDGPPCLEIDLLEGNAKALQATLHTTSGHGTDGRSCNADGVSSSRTAPVIASRGRSELVSEVYVRVDSRAGRSVLPISDAPRLLSTYTGRILAMAASTRTARSQ